MKEKTPWNPPADLLEKYEGCLAPLTTAICNIVENNPKSRPTMLDLFWSSLKNESLRIERKLDAWIELCQLYGAEINSAAVFESAPIDHKGEIHCKASRALVTVCLQGLPAFAEE